MKNLCKRTTSPESVANAILLTDFEEVDDDAIRSWTDDQRAEAFEWAMREHIGCAEEEWLDENGDCPNRVERLPEPAHVKAMRATCKAG